MRSGLIPVECLKKLEGRIISFHLKDLNQMGGGHDVPWGTGKADMKAILTEILRQGVKAVFSIEYEHNWDNSVPEIAQCVEYFDKTAAELAAKKK
jgi:sugar phosphate isomerase/epimerase